jgi:hypothetical protein
MSYAKDLGLLKTIADDEYIDGIKKGIDLLGAKMEEAGYAPADIRRYFRRVLARLAGEHFADCCWDFFVWSRANMLFRYAEENYDKSHPNSLGLLWKITFGPREGIERCRWDAEYLQHGTSTEEQNEKARQKMEELQRKFIRERGGLVMIRDRSALK